MRNKPQNMRVDTRAQIKEGYNSAVDSQAALSSWLKYGRPRHMARNEEIEIEPIPEFQS
jgi:hypothetical protein